MKKIFGVLLVLTSFLTAFLFVVSCGNDDNPPIKEDCTVSFDANGASTTPKSQTVKSGESITLPSTSRNGYTFNGWYSEKSGGTKLGDAGSSYKVSTTITLYAQWTQLQAGEYPLHTKIIATTFWAGEGASDANGFISNVPSAWDQNWGDHYKVNGQSKEDTPDRNKLPRDNDFIPVGYNGTENLYYYALPYNDASSIVFDGDRSTYPAVIALDPSNYEAKDQYGEYVVVTKAFNNSSWRKRNANNIPWYNIKSWGSDESIVKGRWARIRANTRGANGQWVYAQWLDAGPYHYDDFDYVFGTSRPRNESNKTGKSPFAGIDLSPAVILKMGVSHAELSNGGITFSDSDGGVEWQFVDDKDVPDGPWKKFISDNKMKWD